MEGICHGASLDLANLDIQVITADTLRLDLDRDRQSLADTVDTLHPALLILDPFVRLHGVDENASQQVAPLLAFLRQLQRQYQLSVLVVHHARKGARNTRAGQALRGSSEFHAWGDSLLYLRRRGDLLTLSVEHRAASSIPDLTLCLVDQGSRISLQIRDQTPLTDSKPAMSPRQRVETILADVDKPLSLKELRQACRMRTSTLCQVLSDLTTNGRISKTCQGYTLS